MSRVRTLAGLHDRLKDDTDGTIAALRLQAKAWRLCALIGLADPARGSKLAQWILLKTVPWVDDEALNKFINENHAIAEAAGIAAGVFTTPPAPRATQEEREWIVTGRAVFIGATCIVHAKTREEAVAKATSGDCIGEVEIDCASLGDFSGTRAEPNVCD